MENIPIIGGTPKEKDEARIRLGERAEEVINFAWNDPKTPEQLKWINMVNRFLAEETKDLGLEFTSISPEQIRFLDVFGWRCAVMGGKDGEDGVQGYHLTLDKMILINKQGIEKLAFDKVIDVRLKEFAVLLHEALHEKGFVKIDIRKNEPTSYRVGYNLKEGQVFHGFNEGVTDLLTMRLLDLHKDEIKEEFGVELNTEQDKNDKNSVWNYINRPAAAVLVANVYVGDFDTLWRGYFTGDMMHLRAIEKKHGKSALRILSLLDDAEEDGGADKIKKIFRFFDEDATQEEKDAIRSRLLGE